MKKHRNMTRFETGRTLLCLVLAGIPLFLCSCASVDPVTGQKVNNFYSMQDEVAMGREAIMSNTKEIYHYLKN